MSIDHALARSALLLRARDVVRLRRDHYGLTDADTNVVANGLAGVVAGDPALAPEVRDEAVALAHRLLDDDAPQRSVLWPVPGLTTWRDVRPGARDADRGSSSRAA